jgi:hypothetical protein
MLISFQTLCRGWLAALVFVASVAWPAFGVQAGGQPSELWDDVTSSDPGGADGEAVVAQAALQLRLLLAPSSMQDACTAGQFALTVLPATEVAYCYVVTNIGSVPLTVHSLEDNALGVLLSGFSLTLNPGASYTHRVDRTPTQTTNHAATWTAQAGETQVSATATARVLVQSPTALDETKQPGQNGALRLFLPGLHGALSE